MGRQLVLKNLAVLLTCIISFTPEAGVGQTISCHNCVVLPSGNEIPLGCKCNGSPLRTEKCSAPIKLTVRSSSLNPTLDLLTSIVASGAIGSMRQGGLEPDDPSDNKTKKKYETICGECIAVVAGGQRVGVRSAFSHDEEVGTRTCQAKPVTVNYTINNKDRSLTCIQACSCTYDWCNHFSIKLGVSAHSMSMTIAFVVAAMHIFLSLANGR